MNVEYAAEFFGYLTCASVNGAKNCIAETAWFLMLPQVTQMKCYVFIALGAWFHHDQ
jgi:hypothetical protein